MMAKERLDVFDFLILILLVSVIVLAPLPFGSVTPWAKNLVFILALAMAGLWFLQCAKKGEIKIRPSPIWAFLAAMAVLVSFQMIPLSPGVIKTVSPATADMLERTLPEYSKSNEARAITLNPHATSSMIFHWTALALILIVVMNTIRTKFQIKTIIITLAVVGSFEALYGFEELFSGNKQIFWNDRKYHITSVTGTFHNKNHFSGFLEIIIPLVLGFFIAISPRPVRFRSLRSKVIGVFSSNSTYRQILVGLSLLLMTIGVYFSLSRAGILCSALSLAGFVFFLSVSSGFRKYTIVLLLILMLTLVVAMGIGSELIINSLEDVSTGRATSWADRMDLWGSAIQLTSEFPLTGVGLGAFSSVFERFQTARFGDLFGDYLHNDWFQIFCETGIVGGLIVVLGCLFVFYSLLRKTLSRRDPFMRWIALGAMMGSFAILLHSFFDYNLYKITSNGCVFAVVFGLWHASAQKNSFWKIPFRPRPLGALCACGLMAAAVWPAGWALDRAVADIEFNNYLASPTAQNAPDDYYFLPVNKNAAPGPCMEAAIIQDPHNPQILYYAAVNQLDLAESLVRQKAEETADSILGDLRSFDPEGYQKTVDSLIDCIKPTMLEVCRANYEKAREHITKAIDISPAKARYHLLYATVLSLLSDNRDENALREAQLALYLSPSKPYVLFEAGQVFAVNSVNCSDPAIKKNRIEFAFTCLKNALSTDHEYTDSVYKLAMSVSGDLDALIKVTPQTAACQRKLAQLLTTNGHWDQALDCLDASLHLTQELSEKNNDMDYATREMQQISNKRCNVLSIIGDWKQRRLEVARHNSYVRENLNSKIQTARTLRKNGRYRESLALCLNTLNQDWKNQAILLEATSLASLPRTLDTLPPGNRPDDLLFRLVMNCQKISAETLSTCLLQLNSVHHTKNSEPLMCEFIRGAAHILANQPEEGIVILQKLNATVIRVGDSWRQRHLPWCFIGMGYELMREYEKAVGAYFKALDALPSHLESLERLLFLNSFLTEDQLKTVNGRIKQLKPEIACNVVFGGKIELLGLSFQPRSMNEKQPQVIYYWRLMEKMSPDHRPVIQFLDENWQPLFTDDHLLMHSPNKPYPMDTPKSGEVVIEKNTLNGDFSKAQFIRIGVATPSPVNNEPRYLISDEGERYFTTSIDLFKTKDFKK